MAFKRSSGILLHVTSLPGHCGIGDLGPSAYHFVDWLVAAGQTMWQMLPLCPVGYGYSPYMGLSAFAANPYVVDLLELQEQGWLSGSDLQYSQENYHAVEFEKVFRYKQQLLRKAAHSFFYSSSTQKHAFEEFCMRESYWLNDYALFQALNDEYGDCDWTQWDSALVQRVPHAIEKANSDFNYQINCHKFVQWTFDRQFKKLKSYANKRGILLVGDIPIFVAHHCADVWTHQEYFYLDRDGLPTVVAGVPPDYFSKTGQRWGNPLYRWNILREQGYSWWIARFRRMLELFDIVRIDHFRGFESYWEIPVEEETAVNGQWRQGPGKEFFEVLQRSVGTLPIIAEDLGIVTPEVHTLRETFGFPGMRVLQFAFTGGVDNEYLPHRYERNTVVYTGTHDNDTTRGWYEKATEHERDFVRRYCQTSGQEIHWDLIRLALQSVADIVIIPFQDVLGLGSEARMNTPGTVGGNWQWRFTWDQVGPYAASRLCEYTALYERCSPTRLHLL
ncbi:MAG: 4-alpha-glucanotransferase [Bacteroidetes bacterium]|nr:4-alpha-glucanotransferase [Bacteroidota bacterium]